LRVRCAVYTRKSTEDGLEQEFNSLHAQREACEAFILSQASLGWTLVPDHYDDGGVSGGTMERPALQRLLADITDGKVDVVVVYKIDRLTRSLSDFARIVEVFDAADASFVSVTQQFNTTTSMGRLTLNVLLSFAQFEREVTAERIRDKIAASKQKGMWMGGGVPLGYRVQNRKLLADEQEAAIVRYLFARYLELRSVRLLAVEATARGYPMRSAKARRGSEGEIEARNERAGAGPTRTFGRGPLYYLLSNPIYIGKVRHCGKIYEGDHAAIIDDQTFAAVQSLLRDQAPRTTAAARITDIHLLTGLIYDEQGERLRPVHTRRGNRRYRYYVSKVTVEERVPQARRGWRLAAAELERIVDEELDRLFADDRLLADQLQHMLDADQLASAMAGAPALKARYQAAPPDERRRILGRLLQRIELHPGELVLYVNRNNLAAELTGDGSVQPNPPDAQTLELRCRFGLRRRGNETRLVISDPPHAKRKPDRTWCSCLQSRMPIWRGSQMAHPGASERLPLIAASIAPTSVASCVCPSWRPTWLMPSSMERSRLDCLLSTCLGCRSFRIPGRSSGRCSPSCAEPHSKVGCQGQARAATVARYLFVPPPGRLVLQIAVHHPSKLGDTSPGSQRRAGRNSPSSGSSLQKCPQVRRRARGSHGKGAAI